MSPALNPCEYFSLIDELYGCQLGLYAAYNDFGEILSVSAHFAIILLALVLEHENFVGAGLLDDFGGDSCSDDVGVSEFCGGVVSCDGYDFVEDDLCAGLSSETLNSELVADLCAVLFSAGLDNCIHVCKVSSLR